MRFPSCLLELFLPIACALSGSLATSAQGPASDGDPLVPLPSVLDYTRGSGFGIALGLGLEYEGAYDGADEYEVELDPRGALQWRSGQHLFFWEGIELGWRARVANDWLLQLNARHEGGRDKDDSDEGNLEGLNAIDSEVVGVVEARYTLDGEWRSWVATRLHAGDDDIGQLGVLAGGYRFTAATNGTGFEGFVYSTFASSEFMNRDFGITPAEAASSGLEEADLSGGYRASGLQCVYRRNLGLNLQLTVEAGIELYGSEIQDSDIARDDFEAESALSLVWQF